MNFLKSVISWATSAWQTASGAVTNPLGALRNLWHFIGSVHLLVSELFGTISRALHWEHLLFSQALLNALSDILGALERIKHWIWQHQVNPVRLRAAADNRALRHWTAHQLWLLRQYDIRLFFASLGYAWRLFAKERAGRIHDIAAARAFSVHLVKAALRTVDLEASDGYNSGLKARRDLVNTIADQLAQRTPLVKVLVKDLVTALTDFLEVDNPLLRPILAFALSKVINAQGVDRLTGDILTQLVDALTGGHKPATLREVEADASRRLTALEARWAQFADDGGQELLDEGKKLQGLAGAVTDLALLGFYAQMVADPAGWAREVNGTAGRVVNGTVSLISTLIRDA